jgi:hypothetical protein
VIWAIHHFDQKMEDEVAAVVVDNGSGMVKVRSGLMPLAYPIAR